MGKTKKTKPNPPKFYFGDSVICNGQKYVVDTIHYNIYKHTYTYGLAYGGDNYKEDDLQAVN